MRLTLYVRGDDHETNTRDDSFSWTAALISLAMAKARGGGTAFPTCRCRSKMVPKNLKLSGNPWERAHSRTLTTRCCSGCNTRPYINRGHVEMSRIR